MSFFPVYLPFYLAKPAVRGVNADAVVYDAEADEVPILSVHSTLSLLSNVTALRSKIPR